MKYYEVTMTTSNQSADKSGNFSTKEKAEAEVKKWQEIVGKETAYYGQTTFDIRETDLYLDKGID